MKNIRMLFLKLIIPALFILNSWAMAEKAPVKFGKPEMSELEMTVYARDTSAAAVILCNYGYFNANEFQFTQVIRTKILKKEGLDFGSYSFNGLEKSAIRGKTFNLENGVLVEEKLKNESVRRVRIYDDYYAINIAMPNVKVGSVVDIEISYPLIPEIWFFQREIPVLHSELIIETSPYLRFRKSQTGFEPLKLSEEGHWVAVDMPAFKMEPLMSSKNNFITKFDIDILDFSYPGYFKGFTTSWEAISNLYSNSDYFGGTFTSALFLNDFAREIKSRFTSPIDQMRAANEYIKRVKWDETERSFTSSTTLAKPYNEKLGNSADINIMLVLLLRKLDFNALPVILSTRENGALSPFYPSLNKINYVAAMVKYEGKDIYFDATEKYLPLGLLPERCVNVSGRALIADNAILVNLKTDGLLKQRVYNSFELTTSNEIIGTMSSQYYDYAAYNFRKKYKESNGESEFRTSVENEYPGLSIEEHTMDKMDSIYLPVKDEYKVNISNQVIETGNTIYLTPLLYDQMTENPFKSDERKFPVDFPYLSEKNIVVKYTLPKNYTIESVPKAISLKLPEGSATMVYNIVTMNNEITVTYRFKINKNIFTMTEYGGLKEFYNQIIVKHAEPIIIKKG